MVLKEKFEKEIEAETFKRIDAIHPLDIYIGHNEKGNGSWIQARRSGLARTVLFRTGTARGLQNFHWEIRKTKNHSIVSSPLFLMYVFTAIIARNIS